MKESLYISPTISTPEIKFEIRNKSLYFIGQSYPSDSVGFYKPVFEWIDQFLASENSEDLENVVFKLKYYNTASSKQFARIFKILEENKNVAETKIIWLYQVDDNEMYEAGIRFSIFTNLKFEVKAYQSD
jgi:hypothetical protein